MKIHSHLVNKIQMPLTGNRLSWQTQLINVVHNTLTLSKGRRRMGTSNNTQQLTSIGLSLLFIISAFIATPALATSTLVTTTTTTNVYDSFGNPTSITVTVTDGTDTFTTATTNSYNNDDTNWYLGRLVCAEVTQTIPGSPSPVSATRVSGFE